MVMRLAEEKARAGSVIAQGDGIVLGADTSVTVDGEILGKPTSVDDARRMLRMLSGRTHTVITGIFAIRLVDGASRGATEITRVVFAPLDDEEINAYVASGEPFDKAGAYGVQGRAGKFVVGIDGCFFNVIGLPLRSVYVLLRGLGWKDVPGRRQMKGSVA